MVAGLIFWKFTHINISMLFVLLIDIIVQFTVGILDLLAIVQNKTSASLSPMPSATSINSSIEEFPKNFRVWAWRLTSSVVFLTLGIQVVIFYIAHQFSENIGSYLLATFYTGVAFAAIFCRYFKIQLNWNSYPNKLGFAKIQLTLANKSYHLSFLTLGILAMLSVSTIIFSTFEWNWANESTITNSKFLCLISFVFLSAFVFEILSLAILDRLGIEERLFNFSNMVIRTYGLMGVGAAVCLWMFGITNSSTPELIFTIIFCTLCCMAAVLKRKPTLLHQ